MHRRACLGLLVALLSVAAWGCGGGKEEPTPGPGAGSTPEPSARQAAAPATTVSPEPVPATPEPVPATQKPVPATPEPVPATPKPVPATPEPVPAAPEPAPAAPEPVPAAPEPAAVAPAPPAWVPPEFVVEEGKWDRRARENMVRFLKESYRHHITNERVLFAMGRVPRQEYMLKEDVEAGNAYKQMWFRIGYGQTITDPGMVAWMIQLTDVQPTDKVLEIGTGSGYNSSVIAQITPHIFSVEIVSGLANRTDRLLQRLGYAEVIRRTSVDGYFGWEEHAPYDKIIVTCAADHIPVPLLQQLKPGGLMVIPVGPRYQPGKLYFVAKDEEGKVHQKVLTTVEFVPLTREVR